MPEQVRYRTKLTQSGIILVRYQTKIRDAEMPMTAIVSSMPMPSYDIMVVGKKSVFFQITLNTMLMRDVVRVSETFTTEHFPPRSWEYVNRP
jgi:hypothetical protein